MFLSKCVTWVTTRMWRMIKTRFIKLTHVHTFLYMCDLGHDKNVEVEMKQGSIHQREWHPGIEEIWTNYDPNFERTDTSNLNQQVIEVEF